MSNSKFQLSQNICKKVYASRKNLKSYEKKLFKLFLSSFFNEPAGLIGRKKTAVGLMRSTREPPICHASSIITIIKSLIRKFIYRVYIKTDSSLYTNVK